ncbi:hypothetical protein HPP92_024386 [Vanilla planifolia]|uniref:Myb-like domain-containing protein n=1 Tax=Vanilla planifolia TaxID=51239 RepID=A0A835PPM3_VANPL|nr:hypothetical protein HPP92_024386 [Vanilla planifolia]
MGRKPCCDADGIKRGPWTAEEDRKLVDFIVRNGIPCWRLVPNLAGVLAFSIARHSALDVDLCFDSNFIWEPYWKFAE